MAPVTRSFSLRQELERFKRLLAAAETSINRCSIVTLTERGTRNSGSPAPNPAPSAAVVRRGQEILRDDGGILRTSSQTRMWDLIITGMDPSQNLFDVRNLGELAVPLGGWTCIRDFGQKRTYGFPRETVLLPDSKVTMHFPIPTERDELVLPYLPKATVQMVNPDGIVVTTCTCEIILD